MSNAPIPGRIVSVRWKQTKTPGFVDVVSPTFLNLSTYGRNLNKNGQSDPTETTTYSEAKTGYRSFIANLTNYTATMEIMVQEGDAITDKLAANSTGDLEIGWEGNAVGADLETWSDAIIASVERPAPYDGVQMFTINWQLSGAPVASVQA